MRDWAVRQARQLPHETIASGVVAAPHSGSSTRTCERARASGRARDRSSWTFSSPRQGHRRWASSQRPRCTAMVPPRVEVDATRCFRPGAGRGRPPAAVARPSGLPAELPVVEFPLPTTVFLDVRALRGLAVGGLRGGGDGELWVDAHDARPSGWWALRSPSPGRYALARWFVWSAEVRRSWGPDLRSGPSTREGGTAREQPPGRCHQP